MELITKIETINRQLTDEFGFDTVTGDAIWRVVWSEDQFEKRFGTYDDITSSGIFIRTVTEVREVPKYRQWIKEKYVLERLVVVPADTKEILTKVSYEPLHVFQDGRGKYLPPKYEACKFIIELIYAAQNKPIRVEVDQDLDPEVRRVKYLKLYEELFGNETNVGDALAHRTGVTVPGVH